MYTTTALPRERLVRATKGFYKRYNLGFRVIVLLVLLALVLPGCSPQAIVTASATEGQAPLTVTFTNTSKNADEYRWDFGDGATLTTTTAEEPVSHEYTIAGTHTVVLTVYKQKSPDKTSVATVTIDVKPGVLTQVKLTPPTAELAIGEDKIFTAEAVDAYGNTIPEAAFNWSLNEDIGTLADGTLTAGTKAGDFMNVVAVTAMADGAAVSARASVTINPDPLSKVSIEAVQVGAGESRQVIATTTDQYDNPVSDAALTWTVLDDNVGLVDEDGLFTAGRVTGSYVDAIEVSASQGAITLTAAGEVTVIPGPLANVFIGPEEVKIGLGMTQQCVAIGTDKYGNRISGLDFAWSVNDDEAGTINSKGLLTASMTKGKYKGAIKAETTEGGVTCSATIDVTVDPDHIAFMSDRNNDEYEFDLYIMDLDGSNQTKLSSVKLANFDFSPDGNRIIFNYDQENICTINTDGTWLIPILSGDSFGEAAWSPDGTKVAFQYWLDRNTPEIYVMDVDGGNLTRLTNNKYYDDYPEWSPDGNKIVFVSGRDGNEEIYVMNADGSNQQRLTNNNKRDVLPDWSPDGSEIVFQSVQANFKWGVYLMNADGTNVRFLTDGNYPTWSPDGTKIVFHGYKDSDKGEIYIMDKDGSNIVRLTKNSDNDWEPVWAPRKAGIEVTEASIAVAAANNLETMTAKEVAEATREAIVRIETDLGSGSGFLISDDGYILTNNHVVSDAEEITVYLEDGTDYEAEVIGRDLVRDIAVIKIDAEDLPYLEFGDPIEVALGESVVVLGYPLGDEDVSITSGIVSKVDFDDGRNISWIQTDSAVNPGNSGGPMLNMQGQVVGVVAAKMVGVSVEGIGFAISANTVNTYLSRLMDGEIIDHF